LEKRNAENQKGMRDYDRRQRLLEVARARAHRWHARAEECRTLADCFTDPTCRRQLRKLAQDYERMAEAAE